MIVAGFGLPAVSLAARAAVVGFGSAGAAVVLGRGRARRRRSGRLGAGAGCWARRRGGGAGGGLRPGVVVESVAVVDQGGPGRNPDRHALAERGVADETVRGRQGGQYGDGGGDYETLHGSFLLPGCASHFTSSGGHFRHRTFVLVLRASGRRPSAYAWNPVISQCDQPFTE